jgi:hypothetical protein
MESLAATIAQRWRSTKSYSEVGGKREESFKRETRHIALVVTSAG